MSNFEHLLPLIEQDKSQVRALVSTDPSLLTTKNNWGHTIIHELARISDSVPDISFMIELGALTETGGHNGESLLSTASRHGRIHIIQHLISRGAKIDHCDDELRQPLHYACLPPGSPEAVDILISAGAKVGSEDSYNDTPLHFACLYLNTESVRLLLDAGANPNCKNYANQTPMFKALLYCARPNKEASLTSLDLQELYACKKILADLLMSGAEIGHESQSSSSLELALSQPEWFKDIINLLTPG